MKHSLLFLLLSLPLLLFSQQPKHTLSPAESKAQLERLGNVLREYDGLGRLYADELIPVRKRYVVKKPGRYEEFFYKYGLINLDCELLLPCEYSYISTQKNSDLIFVTKDTLMGFVDRNMNWVVPMIYRDIYSETEWIGDMFYCGKLIVEKNGKAGVIDTTGKLLLPCQYDYCDFLSDNLFCVYNEYNNTHGGINLQGDTVIPFDYTRISNIGGGKNFILVRQNDKYGFVNSNGKVIVPCQYEDFNYCWNGKVSLKKDGKWGVLDTLGNVVLPFIYDNGLSFYLPELAVMMSPKGCGAINLKGDTVIPLQYNIWFSYQSKSKIAMITHDEAVDIYDSEGHILASYEEMSYDGMDALDEELWIPIRKNGKWGFLDLKLNEVVPCKYDFVAGVNGEYLGNVQLDNGNTALIDSNEHILAQGPYRYISPFGDFYCVSSYDNEYHIKEGFIDSYGNSTFTKAELDSLKIWHKQYLKQRKKEAEQAKREEKVQYDFAPSTGTTSDSTVFYYTEEMPEFPGGPDSLNRYLATHISYPEIAREKGVSGTVLAQFVVSKDGIVKDVTIKVPLYDACDEEVVRAISGMPKWKPGTNMGQPVNCYYQVPVTFRNDEPAEER